MKDVLEIEGIQLSGYALGKAIAGSDNGWKIVGEAITSAVNSMHVKEEKAGAQIAEAILQDHRTLQQKAIGLVIQCLYAIGQTEMEWTDARNEASIKQARKFAQLVDDGDLDRYFPFI